MVGLTTGLNVDMAVEGLTRYVAGVDEKNGRGFGFSLYGLIAINKIYQIKYINNKKLLNSSVNIFRLHSAAGSLIRL